METSNRFNVYNVRWGGCKFGIWGCRHRAALGQKPPQTPAWQKPQPDRGWRWSFGPGMPFLLPFLFLIPYLRFHVILFYFIFAAPSWGNARREEGLATPEPEAPERRRGPWGEAAAMAGALGAMFANQQPGPPPPPPPGPPGGPGPAGLIPPPPGPRNPNNTLVDELEASFEVRGGAGWGKAAAGRGGATSSNGGASLLRPASPRWWARTMWTAPTRRRSAPVSARRGARVSLLWDTCP